MAQDERVIKEYEAAKMISPYKLDVAISLTNKRVILFGKGLSWFGLGENRLIGDVHINKVTGTDVFKGRSFSLLQLIIGALISIFGISMLGNGRDIGNGIITLIIGILIIIFSFKAMFFITIKAENIDPLTIGKERASIVRPARDSDIIVKEIGAMILDIQNYGDTILEKLKCPNPDCKYMRSFGEKSKHCPECGTAWSE